MNDKADSVKPLRKEAPVRRVVNESGIEIKPL